MTNYLWKELLTQWSREIIESGEYAEELAPEVVAAGWLGYPGATEAAIAAAESRLGTSLPPSCREFLRVTNGWRMTGDFVSRIRPAAEIEWFAAEDPETVGIWIEASEGDDVPDAEYLVYGPQAVQPLRAAYLQTALAVSDYGDGIYLLNPRTVTPDGEWEAWFFAHWIPGADRYRSFWELMEAEHESFLDMLKRERGEPTPSADPSLAIDAQDLEGLVAALKHPEQRRAALEALGNLRDRRAFEPVLAIFQDPNENLFVRECAARTLGELRDPRAAQVLIDAFRVRPAAVSQIKASSLLGDVDMIPGGESLTGLLDTLSIEEMIDALEPILGAQVADQMRATLTPMAVGQGLAGHLNHAVKQGLLILGEAGLPALLEALHDEDPQVRCGVISTLCSARGRGGSPPGVFEHLRVAFGDPDPAVRATVAAEIEQLFDRRAVDLLLNALGDEDPRVRASAAKSLGLMAPYGDAERIATALTRLQQEDPDPQVRHTAGRFTKPPLHDEGASKQGGYRQ